jgi:hypothetical protein
VTDYLEVKPIRTFAHGKDLKTKKSDPFPVEAGEAKLLEAQGLVEIKGEAKEPKVEETEAPVITSEAGKPKQRGKPNGHNEGS